MWLGVTPQARVPLGVGAPEEGCGLWCSPCGHSSVWLGAGALHGACSGSDLFLLQSLWFPLFGCPQEDFCSKAWALPDLVAGGACWPLPSPQAVQAWARADFLTVRRGAGPGSQQKCACSPSVLSWWCAAAGTSERPGGRGWTLTILSQTAGLVLPAGLVTLALAETVPSSLEQSPQSQRPLLTSSNCAVFQFAFHRLLHKS